MPGGTCFIGGLLNPTPPTHRWWVAATVMLSSFLVPMSQSAMHVALPQIMTVFGLDLDQAQWIVTAYVIAGAMVVPAVGWLGNWLGNRTFYVLCLSLFVANSALCALSWSGSSLIACELLAKEPLVDLRVYTNITFAAVSGVIVLFFMTFAASTFLLVILMQRLLDYSPARAGLVLLPGSLVLALSFPLAGRVADRCDHRVIMLCALSIFALSSYLSTFLSLEWPLIWIVWLVVLRFSSGGFVYAPMMATALSQLTPEKVRMGAGMLNLMQQGFGHTLGLALVTTVLQRRLTYHSSVLDQQQIFSALNWAEILAPVRELVRQAGSVGQLAEVQVRMLVQRHLVQQATVAAYQDCFMLVTLLCLAAMPLVLLLRKPST